jgi:hypothetical protein
LFALSPGLTSISSASSTEARRLCSCSWLIVVRTRERYSQKNIMHTQITKNNYYSQKRHQSNSKSSVIYVLYVMYIMYVLHVLHVLYVPTKKCDNSGT